MVTIEYCDKPWPQPTYGDLYITHWRCNQPKGHPGECYWSALLERRITESPAKLLTIRDLQDGK